MENPVWHIKVRLPINYPVNTVKNKQNKNRDLLIFLAHLLSWMFAILNKLLI